MATQKTELPSEVREIVDKYPEWGADIDMIIMPPLDTEIVEEFPEAEGSDALKPYMTSFGVSRGAQYCHLRRKGMGHKMAEMVACQGAPAIMTDSVFKAGLATIGDQFTEGSDNMRKTIGVARQNGYNPGVGDIYMGSLARFQGDPEAFVPPTEGRGYIRRLCEKRGWACDGAVKVAAREPENEPRRDENKKYLANDLVDANVKSMVRQNPDVLRRNRKALRKEIIDRHGM